VDQKNHVVGLEDCFGLGLEPIVWHGSADTVVRAMNVKYRKWRFGGWGPITLKPLNRFP